MSRAARWWLVFVACNVVVALALIWTTRVVVALEESELHARAEGDHQESLRMAMWRMDSWLALLFAREAARPSADYRSIDSPLLTMESEYITLHFEIDGAGRITSPQVPGDAVASVPDLSDEQLAERQALLDRYRGFLDPERVAAAVAQVDTLVDTELADPEPEFVEHETASSQLQKTQNEFDARAACSVPRPPGEDLSGRQVVTWLGPSSSGDPQLVFLRATEAKGDPVFQGFVLDWPRLRERLLSEIADLFPDARLEPAAAVQPADPLGRGLANIPVTLVVDPPEPVRAGWVTGGRTALAVAWLAAILAAVVVGTTLRKSIDLGERRRRFVSAVTHELRTPLTTFEMYSEMLADGLVPDEKRPQYLQTLKEESQRLSAMVANVLTYSRIEERGQPRGLESMTVEALLDRVKPPLERRISSTPMTLNARVEGGGEARVAVDAEAIGRILGNLVDNAAKYANGAGASTIDLAAAADNGSLVMTVRDHGPGIDRGKAAVIFDAFERGGRDPSDPVPGVGLGLALARGLARDMGGELTLESPAGGGALFRLELPTAP